MKKGYYEQLLLDSGYTQKVIDEMIELYQKETPSLTREEICEEETSAWSE